MAVVDAHQDRIGEIVIQELDRWDRICGSVKTIIEKCMAALAEATAHEPVNCKI